MAALAATATAVANREATLTPIVHTSASEQRSGERLKTIPITRHHWDEPASAVSQGPGSIGRIEAGDRIEGALDMEVTVCLKPNANHPGPGQPCVGKLYSYDPHLRAQIVLADREGQANPRRTLAISPQKEILCTQGQPNRNHHCVIQIPWSGKTINDPRELPCDPAQCYMNVAITAYNGHAKPGELVVLGSSDDQARISQGRAKLSTALLKPGDQKPIRKFETGKPATKRAPVVAKSDKVAPKVIYSLPVGKLHAGDQLLVDAKAATRITKLPYIIFQRTELILADSPNSTADHDRFAAKAADSTTRIGVSNGYNCTQGPSGFRDPCSIRKTGILSVRQGSPHPLYINLIVGQQAHGISTQYEKWKPSDRVRVADGAGFIRVRLYSGDSSCSSCHGDVGGDVGAGQSFDRETDADALGEVAGGLIRHLRAVQIEQGRFSCIKQSSQRRVVCSWSSSGQFGDSRRYACEGRAFFYRGRDHWDVAPCKDAFGAQLWHLLQERGDEPTYAGGCSESKPGFSCRWFAQGERPSGDPYFCRGGASYRLSSRDWVIDPCHNERA